MINRKLRNYVRYVRTPLSLYIGLFIILLLGVFFLAFGYFYLIKLSECTEQKNWLRETAILSTISWYNKYEIAKLGGYNIDSTKKHLINSIDNLKVTKDKFVGMGELVDSLDSLVRRPNTVLDTKFDTLIREFQIKVNQKRFREWRPYGHDILVLTIKLILTYVFLMLIFTPLLAPFLKRNIPESEDIKPQSRWQMYLAILSLWIFFVFLLMIFSGRVLATSFLLYIVLWFIILVIFLIFRSKLKVLVKEKVSIEKITYFIFFVFISLMIVGIFSAVKKGVFCKFLLDPESNLIIAEMGVLQILSLEIGLATLLLIVTVIYSVFPAVIQNSVQIEEKQNKINFFKDFFINNCWGWNRYYHYYLHEIIQENNISIFLGIVGSLIIIVMPFLFTSAIYYSTAFFLSGYLTASNLSIIHFIIFTILILYYKFRLKIHAFSKKVITKAFGKHKNIDNTNKNSNEDKNSITGCKERNFSQNIKKFFMKYYFVLIILLIFITIMTIKGNYFSISSISFIFTIIILGRIEYEYWVYNTKRPNIFIMLTKIIFVFLGAVILNLLLKTQLLSLIIIISIFLLGELWLAANEYNQGPRHWQFFLIIIAAPFTCIFVLLILKTKLTNLVPGILSRLFLIQEVQLPFSEFIAFVGSIIPLLLFWVSPIIAGFELIDSKFRTQTIRILRWILQHLQEHTIIFGNGDLGKKIASNIVNRVVSPSINIQRKTENLQTDTKKFFFAEVLSTRKDIGFIDIPIDMIVVDKDKGTFDERHFDSDYGILGIDIINDTYNDVNNKERSIALLGLVGDCKEPGVQDDVNMEISKNIIFSAPDEEAVFPLFNKIYKIHENPNKKETAPSAIICVERGLYGSYLEWRSISKNIYFIYPAFLRGSVLGEIINDDMLKQEFTTEKIKKNNKKILILGRGVHLFYLILTIFENFKKHFLQNTHIEQDAENLANSFIEKNIICVSDEEYIEKKSVITNNRRIIKNKWFPQKGKWAINIPIGTYIKKGYWNITTYHEDPSHSVALEYILTKHSPKIIMIASNKSSETISTTQELLLSLERINASNKKITPHIFIGSRKIEWHEVRDAIHYWRTTIDDRNFFPIQGLDSVVDTYDDTANMITGLYETLLNTHQDSKDKIVGAPVEISRCATRVPYGLAEFLSTITNLRFELSEKGKKVLMDKNKNLSNSKEIQIPIFHNYRSINMKSAICSELVEEGKIHSTGFCFFGGITPTNITLDKLKDYVDYVKKRHHVMVIGTKTENVAIINSILTKLFENKKNCLPQMEEQTKCMLNDLTDCSLCNQCVKRRLCPIAISSRHLEIVNKNIKQWEKRLDPKFSGHCLCNCPTDDQIKLEQIRSPNYAQVAICGYGAENYGSLARVINLLVFRDYANDPIEKLDYVIDEKCERCFNCFNPSRNYYKFYGNLVNREPDRSKKINKESFINGILIRSTTKDGFRLWKDYAQLLLKLVNQIENKYVLFVKKPDLILIFRRKPDLFEKIKIELEKFHEENPQYDQYPYSEPDYFLFGLRGYNDHDTQVWKGICIDRETTCPFEKIQDEARKYRFHWEQL